MAAEYEEREIRAKDLTNEATEVTSEDYILIDSETEGTRRIAINKLL